MNSARVSENYYLERKEKYWKQLGRLFDSSIRILPRYFDTKPARQVVEETHREFDAMLSKLPDIGGDSNMLIFVFVSSAAALAFIRVLERENLAVDVIGTLINEVYDDVFSSLPGIVKRYMRWSEFSSRNQSKLEAFARESQLRKYPENWVMEYVEGDGDNFDFGCNYTECAVLKLCAQMNAKEYMPHICVMDFTMSRALRTGLYRSTTLHYGGECCDFRYRKNQLGLPSFPIKDLPEFKNRK